MSIERGFSTSGGIYLKTEQQKTPMRERQNALVLSLLAFLTISGTIIPIATNRFSKSVAPESHMIQTVDPHIAQQARYAHDKAIFGDPLMQERPVIK